MWTMARGEFLFTDENIFNIEEIFNWQTDRVYASTSRETHDKSPRIQRETIIQLQSWFCWGVSYDAITISVKRGWKLLPKSMRTSCWSLLWSLLAILCSIMTIGALSRIWHLPTKKTLPRSGSGRFSGLNYSEWLALQQLRPQPNTLQEWALIEGLICKKGHQNIEILKCSLMKVVADFPKETLRNAIDGWSHRLRNCVKAKGDH